MAGLKEDCAAAGIASLYDNFAREFDRDRCKDLMEAPYLQEILTRLNGRRHILDLGCGRGEPIGNFFIKADCHVTGVDIARSMLDMCRARFPESFWIRCDMRSMKLRRKFDAIIAWDSLFHLTQDDQRQMFPVFREHLSPEGLLMFTSGLKAGRSVGCMYGCDLYHASLDAEEYESLLASIGFKLLLHRIEDPDCGNHTVWIAQKSPTYKNGTGTVD
jgi:predicted TPR repeat methyltransferase